MAGFDAKQAVSLLEQSQYIVARLQAIPQIVPAVKEIFAPLFDTNGTTPAPRVSRRPAGRKRGVKRSAPKVTRKMSAAQRKARSVAMKRRWATAKKAGKTAL